MVGSVFIILGFVLLAALSLLTLLAIRQVGLLLQRFPRDDPSSRSAGRTPLAPGARLPQDMAPSADGQQMRRIAAQKDGQVVLLFAAFSCGHCRPMIADLAGLEPHLRQRLILMMLDDGLDTFYAREVGRLENSGTVIVRASGLAEAFGVSATPYVYVVDHFGVVSEATKVLDTRSLEEILSRCQVGDVATHEEKPSYV